MTGPDDLLSRLRERRLIRYVLLYAAGAWLVAQVVEFFLDNYGWSQKVLDIALFLLVVGFPALLTIAWYHGERGYQRVQRLELGILGVLAATGLVGSIVLATRDAAPGRAGADPAEAAAFDLGPSSVAVLPFTNNLSAPDLAWLDRGLAELLATDLSQFDSLRVVTGQRLFDLLRQLGVEGDRTVPEEHHTRVTRRAGARYMLTGSISGSATDAQLVATLTDAVSGEIEVSTRARGSDIFALVDRVSADLSAGLLDRVVTPAEKTPVAQLTTPNLEAYAEYQRGREAGYRLLNREAEEHLRRATELDDTFALAHFHLAGVLAQAGDFAGAAERLRLARDNLTHAADRDRLFIEGQSAMIEGDIDTGELRLRELISRYPDEKDARFILAGVLRARDGPTPYVGRLIEETIRLDPLYATGYNQLAYYEARRGNLDSAVALAETYVRLDPGQPNPLDSRGEILEMAGRPDEARDAYRAALAMNREFTVALRHLVRSYLREDRGGEARAELAGYMETGSAASRVVARTLEADAYLWDGELEAGLASLEAAVAAAPDSALAERTNALRVLLFAHAHLGRWEGIDRLAARMAALQPSEGSAELAAIVEAGEHGRTGQVDALGDELAAKFRDDPSLVPFFPVAENMAAVYRSFYRGDHEDVLELARTAPFTQGSTGTEYPGYPVMRALIALGQGERAVGHVDVARSAGITGVPGQWDSLTLRILQYFEGRARELVGDTAGAIEAYGGLVDGWGEAADGVPLVADVRSRLTALAPAGG